MRNLFYTSNMSSSRKTFLAVTVILFAGAFLLKAIPAYSAVLGEACSYIGDCDAGLDCLNNVCKRVAGLGEPCNLPNVECGANFICRDNVCKAACFPGVVDPANPALGRVACVGACTSDPSAHVSATATGEECDDPAQTCCLSIPTSGETCRTDDDCGENSICRDNVCKPACFPGVVDPNDPALGRVACVDTCIADPSDPDRESATATGEECNDPAKTCCRFIPIPPSATGGRGIIIDCALEKPGEGYCSDVNALLLQLIRIGREAFKYIGALAFFFFIYGGLTIILSMGSAEKAKKGHQILVAAVIGLLIAFSAYILIDFVLDALGVTAEFRGVQ